MKISIISCAPEREIVLFAQASRSSNIRTALYQTFLGFGGFVIAFRNIKGIPIYRSVVFFSKFPNIIVMVANVVRLIQKGKIFNSIVRFVSVNMVNYFFSIKFAFQILLHNIAVQCSLFPVNMLPYISVLKHRLSFFEVGPIGGIIKAFSSPPPHIVCSTKVFVIPNWVFTSWNFAASHTENIITS